MRTVGGDDSVEDGWEEEEIYQIGIELRAPSAGNDLGRRARRKSTLIAPSKAQDVEGIGNGDDPCRERNLVAGQATGVSASVPTLMVREDAVSEIGIEVRDRVENFGSAPRVGLDGAPLFVTEIAPFVNDVEECLMDLAYVVEEGDLLDHSKGVWIDCGFLGEHDGVRRDATDVGAGIGVVGVDRVEKSLEGGRGEALHRPSAVALPGDEPGEGAAGDSEDDGEGVTERRGSDTRHM